MKVTIIDRQPATTAYLRHVGPYGKALSDFWMKEVAPWTETNGLFGRRGTESATRPGRHGAGEAPLRRCPPRAAQPLIG
jgi:hypothetical protein